MKIIVGLGNPGDNYKKNRHNTGFMVLDKLAQNLGQGIWKYKKAFKSDFIQLKSHTGEVFVLIKPQTFMNNSGEAVRFVVDYYKKDLGESWQESLYVVYDDLDLILGAYKIQSGKGPKVHNGLLSINQHLKTLVFNHVRVGIDSRSGVREVPAQNYLLQNFAQEEVGKLNEVIAQIIARIINLE